MKTLSLVPRRMQRGASLMIVLILLLVMTVLGLAVLRSTLLEERMSANLQDRSYGFQSAESALREAEERVRAALLVGANVGFDCTLPGQACAAVPVNAYTGNVAGCSANAENCWIDAVTTQVANVSAGSPQFYVEFMGDRDSTDVLGQGSNANANQYGGSGGVPLERLYRITARSNDPSISTDRAVVVLQSNISIK